MSSRIAETVTPDAAAAAQTTSPLPPAPVEIELRPLAKAPVSPEELQAQVHVGRRHWGGAGLFVAIVALPILATAFFLFAIVAPRYASETSFIVRSSGGGGGGSGVSAIMQSKGVSRAVDETFAVEEYLTSPDVIAKLVANNGLRDILRRPEADIFYRYPGLFSRENQESLRKRFETMVTQDIDEGTGIARIEVVAFRAGDAQAVATALIGYAEAMVNSLNERAYKDALAVSNKDVESAMAEVRKTETTLTAYRDASGTVDPNGDALATMKMVQSFTGQLSRTDAAIHEQEAMAPKSPQTAALRQKAEAIQQEIDHLKSTVAGPDSSTVNKMAKYEELVLRREIAAKTLENAVMSREKARENADSQHLYVQVIRAPSLADVARYPRVFVDLLSAAGVSLMLFFVLRGLLGATWEHRA